MSRTERFYKITSSIEEFGEIFTEFLDVGEPVFTEAIDTAAVSFGPDGENLALMWNPIFFDECSDYKLKFVLCHEMLHLFLEHGKRGVGLKNSKKANVCMDISINHMLIEQYGFIRSQIEGWESLCWRDTVFTKEIKPLPSFESYYNIDDSFFKKGMMPIDSHNFFPPTGKIKEKLGEMKFPVAGGDTPIGKESSVSVKATRKRKFENLVKGIVGSFEIKKKAKISDSWAALNRKMVNVAPDMPGIKLNAPKSSKSKYKIGFFIDNSGSCAHMVQRFCKVAASLDEKVFEVFLYSFDTALYSVLRKKDGSFVIRGGGGTSFKPILKCDEEENFDSIFVVTDGLGDKVYPKSKRKYFWFLTEGGSSNVLRGAGNIIKLSQYE